MSGRHAIKTLGLALLVAVGLMAASASAAQANWVLLRNGTSVSSLNLTEEVLLGSFLVPGWNLTLHCPGGVGSGTVNNTGTAGALVVFKGCTVVGSSNCTIVDESGLHPGEIHMEASGALAMSDAETATILASSEEFTTIYFVGAKCTLPEEAALSGSLITTLLEASVNKADHLAHLDDEGLFWGGEPVTIDGAGGAGAILCHIREALGAAWAIHL